MLSCTKLCHVLLYCIWSAHNMIDNNRASIQLSDFHMQAVNFLYDWNPSYEFWGKRMHTLMWRKNNSFTCSERGKKLGRSRSNTVDQIGISELFVPLLTS